MKKVILIGLFLVIAAWDMAHSAQLIGVDFGTVSPGQTRTKTFELDAGLFTGTADTPFTVVQVPPFQVSPASGTMKRIRNTVFTVTLPASTPPGAYDVKLKINVQTNDGVSVFSPLAKATVLGFPFEITPPSLNLGTASTGTLFIKHIGGTVESYTVTSAGVFTANPASATIQPGQTHQINIIIGQAPGSGTATDVMKVKHLRTNEERAVSVSTTIGGKPDLVSTVAAVKVFPRATGSNKVTIQVTYRLQNAGFVASTACAGKISLDNDKVLDIAVPAMTAGQVIQDQTTTVVFETNLTGDHKVKAIADSNDQINELSENNNVGIKDIVIPQ